MPMASQRRATNCRPLADVPDCKGHRRELIAFARLGEDLSFTYSSWNEGIQPWNFNLRANTFRRKRVCDPYRVRPHAVSRGRNRQHEARRARADRHGIPCSGRGRTAGRRGNRARRQRPEIQAAMCGSTTQGVAESVWKIPPEAKLGVYRLTWTGTGDPVERRLPRGGVPRAADARRARGAERAADRARLPSSMPP